MSLVIPFHKCKARPDESNYEFLLTSHLAAVAVGYGKIDGCWEDKLYFLGGLCHDAAKGRRKWQENLNGPKGSRPPHAGPSAIIFSYFASCLLEAWVEKAKIDRNQKQILRTVVVQIARDIYDHHRELGDIEHGVPWGNMSSKDLSILDLDTVGLFQFISGYFLELAGLIQPLPETITEWEKDFRESWPRWSNYGRVIPKLSKQLSLSKQDVEKKLCFKHRTARFISTDRTDAARITPVYLDPDTAKEALIRLDIYCKQRAASLLKQNPGTQGIINRRATAQTQSVERYLSNPDKYFYVLSLPTGLGKTLTSLVIGLKACAEGRCRRIIYSAPYISILSQATNEIRKATELEVLQHHHLSVLTEQDFDDKDILISESWQAQVVTTTFNQLFRALFPYRAQDLVRLPAMEGAFIIVDEPQIIDSVKWNTFLTQLQTATKELHCQVIFISATQPPFEYAGIELPFTISTSVTVPSRYRMDYYPEVVCEDDVSDLVISALPKSTCVVMNTIRDASEVYLGVKERLMHLNYVQLGLNYVLDNSRIVDSSMDGPNLFLYNLNGLMTPIHKELIIDTLNYCLKRDTTVVAVSTQVVEAGVDLSFQRGIRACAIQPCHVQFAGRNNRHGEGDIAAVKIVNYLRSKEIDSRKWVYTSSIEREETEKLMQECKNWDESTCLNMLDKYYRKTFERNPNKTLLQYYSSAALGNWSLLAGIEPFNKNYPTAPVFIPWPDLDTLRRIIKWYFQWMRPRSIKTTTVFKVLKIMEKYGTYTVEEIYEKYTNREFMRSLDFVQRKLFMALLQQFVVSVGSNLLGITFQTLDRPILCLISQELYSLETGLAHHVGNEDRELYF